MKVIIFSGDESRKIGERKFWNKTAPKYDNWVESAFSGQYHSIKSKLSSYIQPGDTILDLGTGTGEIAFHISKNCKKCICIGTDISSEMIAVAQSKIKERGQNNLTFQAEDAYNLSFPDATFDKIVCVNALQTMKDPINAIKECYRVLKPGGEFLSFTYCFGDSSLWEQLKLAKWVILYGTPRYWTNFTRKDLANKFKNVGFMILESEDVWQKPVILFLRCKKD